MLSKVRRDQQSCTTQRATTTGPCISTHRPITYPALVQLPLTVSAHARVRSSHVTPQKARPQYRRQGDRTFNYSKRQRRLLLKDTRHLQLLNSTKFWSSFSWLNHYILAFPCIRLRNSQVRTNTNDGASYSPPSYYHMTLSMAKSSHITLQRS